jgi:hypothetical protein
MTGQQADELPQRRASGTRRGDGGLRFERAADEFHILSQALEMCRRDLISGEAQFRRHLLSEWPIEHTDVARGTSHRVGLVGCLGGLVTFGCSGTEPRDPKCVSKYGDELSGRCPREPERVFEVCLERIVRSMSVTTENITEDPRMKRGRLHGAQVFTRAVLTVQPEPDNRDR